MRVVRMITYEGDEEDLVRQLKHSASDGIWCPLGALGGKMTMTIKTIEEPDSSAVHRAIMNSPNNWPTLNRAEETNEG
jgi:hypothetical protein